MNVAALALFSAATVLWLFQVIEGLVREKSLTFWPTAWLAFNVAAVIMVASGEWT